MTVLRNLFIAALYFLTQTSVAQVKKYTPGPANLDTSQFSHVYLLRDKPDEFPDSWMGVIINNDQGMCVKAKMNSITAVHTALQGITHFHAKAGESLVDIELNLSGGSNHYIELYPYRKADEQLAIHMNVLREDEALNRIGAFSKPIEERYCILPFDGDNDYLRNVYPDSVNWYAGESYEYRFKPLDSWEVIRRSKLRTVFSFRNSTISTTYSEIGGINYLPLTKCKSKEAFETYCREKFAPSTIVNRRDKVIASEFKPVQLPEGIMFAQVVTIENSSITKKRQQDLLRMRTVYIVFFWKDEKGKGNSAYLYTSERGNTNELHAMATLEERLLESWQSFRLARK
jgi:hypothetical protein